jgi:hypothetical protein
MDVFPDIGALTGSDALSAVVGSLLTLTLVIACLMLLISAAAWAVSHSAGNFQGAARARIGVFVSLGAAVLAGGGGAWLNFLIGLGPSL